MRIATGKRPELIAIRISTADRRKLEFIAEQTDRSMSDVLRALIRQAMVTEKPDVILAEISNHAQA